MIHAALDTSLAASFAIADGDRMLANCTLAVRGRNSDEQLVPWLLDTVKELGLELSDIERWTVGTGPGSFSGIRVGISWVLGVCAATGAAARGVPSSLALACEATKLAVGEQVGVLHDARRKQVILSTYRLGGNGLSATGTPAVTNLHEIAVEQYAVFVTAQDAVSELVGSDLGDRLQKVQTVDARRLLRADSPWPKEHGTMIASLEPVYVRPAVFVKPRPIA
jgi:tRNA threonylcarbamoyladenosine biosynthesis protein TsaB